MSAVELLGFRKLDFRPGEAPEEVWVLVTDGLSDRAVPSEEAGATDGDHPPPRGELMLLTATPTEALRGVLRDLVERARSAAGPVAAEAVLPLATPVGPSGRFTHAALWWPVAEQLRDVLDPVRAEGDRVELWQVHLVTAREARLADGEPAEELLDALNAQLGGRYDGRFDPERRELEELPASEPAA